MVREGRSAQAKLIYSNEFIDEIEAYFEENSAQLEVNSETFVGQKWLTEEIDRFSDRFSRGNSVTTDEAMRFNQIAFNNGVTSPVLDDLTEEATHHANMMAALIEMDATIAASDLESGIPAREFSPEKRQQLEVFRRVVERDREQSALVTALRMGASS